MLFVSYLYYGTFGRGQYESDTVSAVVDFREPESAEDIDDLEDELRAKLKDKRMYDQVTIQLLNWKPLKNSPGRRSPRTPALELDTRMFDSREEAVSVLRRMIAKEEITAEELQMAPCDVVSRIEERTVAQLIQRVHKIGWLNEAERKKLINWLSL